MAKGPKLSIQGAIAEIETIIDKAIDEMDESQIRLVVDLQSMRAYSSIEVVKKTLKEKYLAAGWSDVEFILVSNKGGYNESSCFEIELTIKA